MTPSIKGGKLPDSPEDFTYLRQSNLARFTACLDCQEPFTTANVQTPAGWRETQISGVCETCFNKLFSCLKDAHRD